MAALMALLAPQKKVGFEPPAIAATASDSDSDSDSDSGAILKKAMEYTVKHKFKRLLEDAVRLDRRNTLALKDLSIDKMQMKQRRLTKMRGLGKKELNIPKMADLVKMKGDKPIIKFRRMARAVLLLIQVCHICKDILSTGVRKEPWFALIDNLIAKSTIQQKRKAPRAFVTFVPNERRELIQLTFDVAEFKRDRRTEFILTDEIREMMGVLPGMRTTQQVAEIIRVIKVIFPNFANYKLHTQKQIGQMAFYDRYKANRVIVKKGHQPDGLYFILSGCVVEKHEGGKQPKLINSGEKFGEGDLVCGNRRRHTVLTKVDSEILYLHRQDYRVIFDMSEDCNNPKNLDICRQHIVFQHFPMQRLVDNPGTWSVINYKYGQLIAKDGNNLDWIYVIKSGEARVFKYLQPNNIDVRARRRKTQAMLNSQSPFYQKKRILNFVEEREYIKSAYRPNSYYPNSGSSSGRLSARSAPPGSSRRTPTPLLLSRAYHSMPSTRQGARDPSSRKSSSFAPIDGKPEMTLPRLVLDDKTGIDSPREEVKDAESKNSEVTEVKEVKESGGVKDTVGHTVIRETLEEVPEDLSARSQNSGEGKQEPSSDNPNNSTSGDNNNDKKDSTCPLLPPASSEENSCAAADGSKVKVGEGSGEGGGGDGKQQRSSGDENRLDPHHAGGSRMMERRLSTDMDGSLFDKPVPGHPGRRQSILMLPGPLDSSLLRRQSSVQVPASPGPGTGAGSEATPARRPSILHQPGAPRREMVRGRSASFLKTPMPNTARSLSPNSRRDKEQQVIQVGNHTLPAFVQVETLHPGQVFGLRACLEPEERGPSVSLVSGECEVLQINKKFFMRHCDDAIYSLIRLKNKPFPSEEDLIDRLDINMQWEEYKQQTLHGFLKECRSAKR